MKVFNICHSVVRVQITNPKTGQWSWGTGFWAKDDTKTKLVTARHLWNSIGKLCGTVNVEYDTPSMTKQFTPGVKFCFQGDDMALLDIPHPSEIIAFDISKNIPDKRALVLSVGYGNSLNQHDRTVGLLEEKPTVMLNRGRIDAHHKKSNIELLEIITMSEPGFSGGPLFIAKDISGNIAVKIDDTFDYTNIEKPEVIGFCRGNLATNLDRVGYETMKHF